MTEIHVLPQRESKRRAAAPRGWQTPSRSLIQRTLDGLHALEHPATCRAGAPINGYAHAHQIMAVHAGHRCPRYDAAYARTQQERP